MLDHLEGSDAATAIQGEALAPAWHAFRMDAFPNPHRTATGKKKTDLKKGSGGDKEKVDFLLDPR